MFILGQDEGRGGERSTREMAETTTDATPRYRRIYGSYRRRAAMRDKIVGDVLPPALLPQSLMTTQSLLRILHILGGVIWVGSVVFTTVFLLPAARAIGPAAGPFMRELTVVRKLPIYLMLIAFVTVLSGATLAYRDMGDLGMRWFEQGSGRFFGFGAILAVAGLVLGMAVNAPTAKQIGLLSAQLAKEGRAPTAEEGARMGALQNRLYTASRIIMVLLLLATASMAFARYM